MPVEPINHDDPYYQGVLDKKGKVVGSYAKRYYRLTDTGLLLEFKMNGRDEAKELPSSAYQISAKTDVDGNAYAAAPFEVLMSSKSRAVASDGSFANKSGMRCGFTIFFGTNSRQEERKLFARSVAERNEWVAKINELCGEGQLTSDMVSADEVQQTKEHTFVDGPIGIGFIIDNSNVVISRVGMNTQADTSGVRIGDVVTHIDGVEIETPGETSEFEQYFKGFARPVKVTMLRFGTVTTHDFTTKPFGIECRVEGFCVKVVEARPDYPAAMFNVKKNDIILEVNGQPFDLPTDALAFSKQISAKELPVSITFKSFKATSDEEYMEPEPLPEIEPMPEPEPEPEPEAEELAFVAEPGFDVVFKDPIINEYFVQFPFEVTSKMTDTTTSAAHRYSDFLALRTALLLKDESIGALPFPGKTLIRANSLRPGVVDMRKEILSLWMDKVLNLPHLEGAAEIADFLKGQ